ncbi:MAG TPA: TIGR02530 family flagellar biosynthesis protein, partial [Clostridia bacterium]|nr:TIGR02530 family flagellar biosynthesis protein [Clostridia bacterium]
NISNDYVLNRSRINGVNDTQKKQVNNVNLTNNKSFKEVLDQISKKDKVIFSKHAIQRLEKRNINLSTDDINQISDAVNKAKAKGVKEALIILRDNAFITSIKNNTVITATTGEDLKENVFTNIDGAVII